MKNKKIEKKLIKMLDNKIVANIVKFIILITPILGFIVANVLVSKI